MGWILGLDVGDVRVGTALAHTDVRLPLPHRTFLRAKGEAEQEVAKLVQEKKIELIVVGLPLSREGLETRQCDKIKNFCRRLGKRVDAKLVYTYEHLSSFEAHQTLAPNASRGSRRSNSQGDVDSVDATIILNSFFDSYRDDQA